MANLTDSKREEVEAKIKAEGNLAVRHWTWVGFFGKFTKTNN